MISWIQRTFQQHFRTIFILLLAIVIVAFVFTIGAAPGIGSADRKALSRTFYGLNLGSAEDTERLFGDAQLSIFLQAGYQALNENQVQAYALQRHAALHLADQLNLPKPSRDDLTAFVRELPAFMGQNGQFDPQAYSRFRDSLKTNSRMGGEAALARVLANDYRYDRVQKLLGGPGYVLDSEVKQQIERGDTSWQIDVASIDYTAFQPNIQPTEAELKSFFESNAFRYEVPAQVRVSYVEFPAAAYADRVNITDADVRAYYDSNPGRFPNPARAQENTPSVDAAEADFAAVRPQVEAALRLERARRLATQAASDLTVTLYDARATADTVAGLLSSRGLKLTPAAPFARNNAPAFLAGNPQNVTEAFRLDAHRPISDALTTPNGAVVLVWQENLPAHAAEFATVQEQVKADYIDNQRRQRFVATGRTLRDAINARLARGEAFAAAATAEAQAQNLQLETKTYGPFVRREPPQDVPYSAINVLERLETGGVSDMVVTGDKGLIVHAASKTTPEVGPGHERFNEVRTQMAQFNASRNADEILREMVQTELARSESPAR
jgi:peptidyl-prolyl cis-trans isomerase D